MSNTIEELVFELAEEHSSGDLEKLIRLLDLVLNGKKNIEPVAPATEEDPPFEDPEPTKPPRTKNARGRKTPEPEESAADDDNDF